nr:FAD-dependent oxidoreductase [Kofleriaceae bacterium]
MTRADVAVIGGGFSGAFTAAHLAAAGVDAVVIEPGELGRGVAYARHATDLLLNAPVAAMSALPDRPAHFADWLDQDIRFAPRAVYGDYVAHALRELARGPLTHARARAVDVEPAPRGFAIALDDGRRVTARAVVLALGNAPPRAFAGTVDAYADHDVAPDEPVALLGSGLTALDVLARLRRRGHRGRVSIVSRRGLTPIAHGAAGEPVRVPAELVASPSLRALLAWWRACARAGASVVARIDALRPLLPALWHRLSPGDRAGFAHHVRPRWEVVRHRAPPEVHAVLARGIADGSVAVERGSLADARARAATIVNCTGPERDLARVPSPLVRALLARRLVARDPLGLGATAPAPGVHVVGPWRVADDWEATAVPELRVQVRDAAAAVVGELRAPRPARASLHA